MNKPLRYDRHAKRRMKWRRITEGEVEQAVSSPDRVERTEEGRTNAFKKLGSRRLKVIYRERPNYILIISAMDKSD